MAGRCYLPAGRQVVPEDESQFEIAYMVVYAGRRRYAYGRQCSRAEWQAVVYSRHTETC